jgi:cyclic-di-AMP phosphodiesterase PgpH
MINMMKMKSTSNYNILFLRKIKELFLKKHDQKPNEANDRLNIYITEVALAILMAFIISLMFPRGQSYKFSGLKEGQIYTGEKIIAPFTYAINKTEEEYKRDQSQARKEVLPVFIRYDSICDAQYLNLQQFFNLLDTLLHSYSDSSLIVTPLNEHLNRYNIKPDENILKMLGKDNYLLNGNFHNRKHDLVSFQTSVLKLLREIYSIGILNIPKSEITAREGKISVLTGNEETVENLIYFNDEQEVKSVLVEKLRLLFANNEVKRNVGYNILVAFITPSIFYDKSDTDYRVNEAVALVPLATGMVLENEKIIDQYEKISKDQLAKLNSLSTEIAIREEGSSLYLSFLRYAGRFLMIALAITPLIIFLIFNRWRLLRSLKKVVLVSVIMILVSSLSYIINKFNPSPYLIPVTIASMLLTIFYDNRLGFIGTITLGVIIGGMKGNDFVVVVVSIITGLVAILSVAKVRSRSWLFKSILLITGANLITITIIEIMRYTSIHDLWSYWTYGVIAGSLSPILAYGLQVLFEYFFDMITDMRLLELSDLNQPLLRRLTIEAPGTYHHSIMVGNLAESAAEAIGANTLLTRVGAYYHDIGKIEKAEYFVENIQKAKNPHEKLSPNMSSLILTNHVRQGLELAQEYKLPIEVQNFIVEHHGTGLISYFYQKAVELNKDKDEEVDLTTFRYPGPKPHTKEIGIVMLADAVEAASRSLKDPSASRIKGLVNSIVTEKFEESELNECPLTLRDLNRIIESFQTMLLGVFHTRIEYPNQEEKFFPKNGKNGKKIKEKFSEN